MLRQNRSVALFLLICFVLTTVLVGCSGETAPEEEKELGKPDGLTILSAPPGGVWNAVAAGLGELLGNQGVRVSVEPGGGVSNVIGCSRGEAELGLTASIIPALGREGAPPFDEVAEDIAGVAVLFDNTLHVVVNKNINNVEDLMGKKFCSQPPGQATQVAFADFLAAHGMEEDDLEMERGGQQEAVQLMQDGHVVGMTAVTGHPSSAILELSTAKDVTFLGADEEILTKMQNINSGYVREIMPANTYPGQADELETVGMPTILIVDKNLSDDEVYWITKALAENIEDVNKMHNATSNLTVEKMAEVSKILPTHPGAQRYYDEVLK